MYNKNKIVHRVMEYFLIKNHQKKGHDEKRSGTTDLEVTLLSVSYINIP